MLLEGHAKRLSEPLRLSRRELLLAAVVVCALVVGGILAVRAGRRASRSVAGPCVSATLATSTGGATLRACGRDRAAAFCRTAAGPDGHLDVARAIAGQCRRLGFAHIRVSGG